MGSLDMALFKFVDAIFKNKLIDIYNRENMYRDFNYIDDLVNEIRLLIEIIPKINDENNFLNQVSLSPVAPYRVVNIGNS